MISDGHTQSTWEAYTPGRGVNGDTRRRKNVIGNTQRVVFDLLGATSMSQRTSLLIVLAMAGCVDAGQPTPSPSTDDPEAPPIDIPVDSATVQVIKTPGGFFVIGPEVDSPGDAGDPPRTTHSAAAAASGCAAVVQSAHSEDWTELPNSQLHFTQSNVTIWNPSYTDCGFVEVSWDLHGDWSETGTVYLDTTLHARKTRRTWWTPNFDSRTDSPSRSHWWYLSVTVNANDYWKDWDWCAIPGMDGTYPYAFCTCDESPC